MKKKGIDVCILFNQDPSFFYFTNQTKGTLVLIPSLGKPIIFLNKLEDTKGDFKIFHYEKWPLELNSFLKKNHMNVLGVNEKCLTIKQQKQLGFVSKLKDLSMEILFLRAIKSDEEVKLIRTACNLTQQILSEIIKNFNFKKENDVKIYIKKRAIDLDCELSFEPIVASGKNGAIPHYDGNFKIKKGFLVIDMGLKYKGYCADITRTLFIGNPSKFELEKYNTILSLQKKAIKKVKSNVEIKELESIVRVGLGQEEKFFFHSLGHGLGLEVHEAPVVSIKSKDKLIAGMVITIEPGWYKEFGIRIEDDVLVTKKGHKLLSNFPKELIIIPKV